MQIHDDIRKCVAFLFSDVFEDGVKVRRPMGTAFLVAVPMEQDTGVIYAVTARHVIEGTRHLGNLSIRFNRDGDQGYEDYWAPHDAWTCHPSTDVAVAPLKVPMGELDVRWVPLDLLANDAFVKHADVSEGDDVYFAGLFVQHYGSTRSQPVLRFGNISLMPREPILAKLDPAPGSVPVEVEAYLVEARSWGGQSGSPAFLHFHLWRPVGIDDEADMADVRPRLLGLVHGHYHVPQDVSLVGEISARGKVPINAGMAIVIPAQKIIDVLMTEELMDERKKKLDEHKVMQTAPQPDTLAGEVDDGRSEFERFENLAESLIHVPKKDIDEKRNDGA